MRLQPQARSDVAEETARCYCGSAAMFATTNISVMSMLMRGEPRGASMRAA